MVRGVIYVDVNPKYRILAATAPPPPTHKRKDSQYARQEVKYLMHQLFKKRSVE